MNVGDVVVIKCSGEKVTLLEVAQHMPQNHCIRRPYVDKDGAIQHQMMYVYPFELETPKEHAERLVAEVIMKGNAQRALIQAEKNFNQEMAEAEFSGDFTPPKPEVN